MAVRAELMNFLNTELKLGSDNINISGISRTFEDNEYIITIDKRDLIYITNIT